MTGPSVGLKLLQSLCLHVLYDLLQEVVELCFDLMTLRIKTFSVICENISLQNKYFDELLESNLSYYLDYVLMQEFQIYIS